MKYIVTRNEDDFKLADIPVLNPIQTTDKLYELRQKNDK